MNSTLTSKLGICQWFQFNNQFEVVTTIKRMQELGLRNLRTAISWADYVRPETSDKPSGEAWYDWVFSKLSEAGIDVLACVWLTPPTYSENGKTNGPPRRLKDFPDFIDLVITRYGGYFSALELWNEPNNVYKWDRNHCDWEWQKFGKMIGMTAHWCKERQVTTVLGGMIPVDPNWLKLMWNYGVMQNIDIVAIHGFPGMWWQDHPNWDWQSDWHGWKEKAEKIVQQCQDKSIWITETGFPTIDKEKGHQYQFAKLQELIDQAVPCFGRVYWYSMIDLNPKDLCIEQTVAGRYEPMEYHLGLLTATGRPKPAFHWLKEMLQ